MFLFINLHLSNLFLPARRNFAQSLQPPSDTMTGYLVLSNAHHFLRRGSVVGVNVPGGVIYYYIITMLKRGTLKAHFAGSFYHTIHIKIYMGIEISTLNFTWSFFIHIKFYKYKGFAGKMRNWWDTILLDFVLVLEHFAGFFTLISPT